MFKMRWKDIEKTEALSLYALRWNSALVSYECLKEYNLKFSFPHMFICKCASGCVWLSHQSVVFCYKNEAVVVNEVAVNILSNRTRFYCSQKERNCKNLTEQREIRLTSSSQLMEHFPSNAVHWNKTTCMWSGHHSKYLNGWGRKLLFLFEKGCICGTFFLVILWLLKAELFILLLQAVMVLYLFVLLLKINLGLSCTAVFKTTSRGRCLSLCTSLKSRRTERIYSSWFLKYGQNLSVDKSIPVCWPSRTFSEKIPVSSGCPRLKEKQNRNHTQNHIISWAF